MTTPSDIILNAMKKAGVLGVGQSASGEDFHDAFVDLQYMLAQWQRKRWLIWHLVDVSKVSTGAQTYTVTSGGDFDVARPDRIEAAFIRQLITGAPNQVDRRLTVLESREDYNNITVKRLGTLSDCIFYDAAYPTGILYPYPVPQASIYEIHISVKEQLGQLTSLGQTLVLPPEYMAALVWNLSQRLRIAYRLPKDDQIIAMAKDSLNLIRDANTQIPRLMMPRGLASNSSYNIYSDQGY